MKSVGLGIYQAQSEDMSKSNAALWGGPSYSGSQKLGIFMDCKKETITVNFNWISDTLFFLYFFELLPVLVFNVYTHGHLNWSSRERVTVDSWS